MFSRMLSAAIFVSAELTRKAFTGFNRGRSYANTESLQKFLFTSTCNFCLVQKKIYKKPVDGFGFFLNYYFTKE